MTPEEQEELKGCVQRISEILYEDARSRELGISNLAEIEESVREQVQKYVSPQVGFFLSTKLSQQKAKNIEES